MGRAVAGMSLEGEIRYCASADGTTIGYIYYDVGRKPPVVFVTHSLVPLESQGLHLTVARGRQVVYFDRRGIGYSQREVAEITEDNQLDDLAAVLSRAGLIEFDLAALGDGCSVASRYAALHPQAVRRLALMSPIARTEQGDALSTLIRTNWGLGRRAMVDLAVGEVSMENRRARVETLRRTVAPEVAAQYVELGWNWQPGPELASIVAATVVMQTDGGLRPPIDRARSIAAAIPGARLVLGKWRTGVGDTAWYNDELRQFLEGDEMPPSPDAISPATRETRGVRTVLFTDIVGHTEMMQRLGDAKGRDVLREHERITRDLLKQHGGAEVKTMGDGFLASFGSVTSAMECAIALQRAFAAHTESMPEPLHVRVGLNAGEPIEEDGDLFGATVILASRIAAKAGAGEILVPDTVRGLLSGKGFVFGDRGEFVPKGFDDAVRLCEVRWRE